ncbi:MAG: hypothetical protein M0R73_00925 [Dehalococcoidia bacterium]|nr:hypothetical protein [Dehalococcoidia bacterium]
MPELLRVVGPAGAGKSLLITSLTESLRSRGYRTASAVQRGEATTVITLSTGSRSTLDRAVPASYLGTVVSWVDPSVQLVFAEGYDDAPGIRAIEVRPAGAEPYGVDGEDLFAVVATEDLSTAFAEGGPGQALPLADRVQREVLGDSTAPETAEAPASPGVERRIERGFGFGRVMRRFRRRG